MSTDRRFGKIPPVDPDLRKALDDLKDKPADPKELDDARGVSPDTTKYVVRVYIDNGVCFEYDVTGAHKAREHATAIINGGYRHNDGKGEFEHYGPHRISKVKISGGVVPTLYPDRVSGT